MNPIYAGHFRAEFQALSGKILPGRQHEIIQMVMDRIPQSWRADASYFLTKNIELMITRPFFQSGPPPFPVNSVNLQTLVELDVDRIIAAAEEEARLRGRPYVSATSVARALGRLADNLETTSLQIWGPE